MLLPIQNTGQVSPPQTGCPWLVFLHGVLSDYALPKVSFYFFHIIKWHCHIFFALLSVPINGGGNSIFVSHYSLKCLGYYLTLNSTGVKQILINGGPREQGWCHTDNEVPMWELSLQGTEWNAHVNQPRSSTCRHLFENTQKRLVQTTGPEKERDGS